LCADGGPPGADSGSDAAAGAGATLRLDKWLWYARFFKSRSLAAKLCAAGKLRLNHATVGKAHQLVREGDVLTFPQGRDIRVVRVRRLGERRGPASEARLLYDDLAPRASGAAKEPAVAEREKGSGRPTKKERRALDRLQEDAPDEA
jgi:ribosome-associated heat shock protein Hsp15